MRRPVNWWRRPGEPPTISVADVESVVDKTFERGENVFEWIWEGLPPAERIIFAAGGCPT